MSGRSQCTGRQMRSGFFVLNLIAWIVILTGVHLLT
jgi:hypothetical protein